MVRSKLSFHSLRLHDNRTVDTIFDLVEFSHCPKSPQIFALTLGAYLVGKLFEYQFRNETPEKKIITKVNGKLFEYQFPHYYDILCDLWDG